MITQNKRSTLYLAKFQKDGLPIQTFDSSFTRWTEKNNLTIDSVKSQVNLLDVTLVVAATTLSSPTTTMAEGRRIIYGLMDIGGAWKNEFHKGNPNPRELQVYDDNWYVEKVLGISANEEFIETYIAVEFKHKNLEKRRSGIFKLNIKGDLDHNFGEEGLVFLDESNEIIGIHNTGLGSDTVIGIKSRENSAIGYTLINLNGIFSDTYLVYTQEEKPIEVVGMDVTLNRTVTLGYREEIANKYSLLRILNSGETDTSFGDQGFVRGIFNTGDVSLESLEGTESNKIFTASNFNNGDRIAIAKYLEDGNLDIEFSGDGKRVEKIPQLEKIDVNGIIATGQGDIYVSGDTNFNQHRNFFIVKYDKKGNRDMAFSSNKGVLLTRPQATGTNTTLTFQEITQNAQDKTLTLLGIVDSGVG